MSWMQGSAAREPAVCPPDRQADYRDSRAANDGALPEAHARVQAFVEFVIDEQGILIALSPAWEAVTGFTTECAIGSHLEQYVWPEDRAGFQEQLDSLLRGDAGNPHRCLRIVTRSGLPREVELRAAARVDEDAWSGDVFGTLLYAEGAARPATALAHFDELVETQVAEHAAAVADAKQALDDFMHTVAHDLRAPLRAIQAHVRMLQGAMDEEGMDAARNCVSRLNQTASRMAAMFDGLLRLSRMGHVSLAVRAVECASLIHGVIAEIPQPPARPAPTFVVDADCVCHADPDLLRQVFANLIGNAVKYSSGREAPRIDVSARSAGPETVFTVRDNGVGFDMQYTGNLFHVFQRLHTRSEFEGCGVGLSIVRRIVERHKGRIWAEAVAGEGAAFHFSLPAAAS